MRKRSLGVVVQTAVLSVLLSFLPRAAAAAPGAIGAGRPGTAPEAAPWYVDPPPGVRAPWSLVAGVALLGLLALCAVALSVWRARRVRRELQWAGEEPAVQTASTAPFVTAAPDQLLPGFELDLDVVPESQPEFRTWLSPLTELGMPTSVRALACPGLDPEAMVEEMSGQLPDGGMAAARLGDRFSLTAPTWRLIDRRILAATVGMLDADVAEPLVGCLARFDQIRAAGQRTLADLSQPEIIETFVPPSALTVSHGITVTVDVGPEAVADVRFRLDVTATFGETALVVRRGEILEVACQELSLSAALVLVGRAHPLWRSEPVRVVDLHLAPHPPVLVPLAGTAPVAVPSSPFGDGARPADPPTVPLIDPRPEPGPPEEARAS
jgi:hypothetical protein